MRKFLIRPNLFQAYLDNIIFKTDSYKLTHWKQYPEGTSKIVSYLESRAGGVFDETIFFGLQPYLRVLEGKVLNRKMIKLADSFSLAHFGHQYFNKKGWNELLKKHGGYLPVTIKALPEGTKTKTGIALMVIENNDPSFPWLTNFLETLLMKVWYTITIATNSFQCRKAIKKYLDLTSENPQHIMFALHDFGYRGVSSEETAGLGGMAHLTSFFGTDTLMAIIYANAYYNINAKTEKDFKMYGFSVPASEHSTATPYGPGDGELDYIRKMLKAYPKGPVSMVADSYNVFAFAGEKLRKLKAKIKRRDGWVVVRPDSGDPVEVNYQLLLTLWNTFGGTTNSKGYKVLDKHVRIIQGDGIDYQMIIDILEMAKSAGFSAENLVFGSGGGLLQKFDRDTLRFAIKCCYAVINGVEVNVSKDPITAKNKKSKAGQLKTILEDGEYVTVSSKDYTHEEFVALKDELVTVFENGTILVKYDFDQVREKISSYL